MSSWKRPGGRKDEEGKKTVIVTIIMVLSVMIILPHAAGLMKDARCKSETQGTVTEVEANIVYVKTFPVHEYSVSYKYYVDGSQYEGQSGWVDNRELGYLETNDSIAVRFDQDDPGTSMLFSERDNHIAWVIGMVIFIICIVIAAYRL